MVTNTESTVINNGNTGTFFTLQRGVRQGCPLSAYLFIIAIEILAIKICDEPSIKGIKIGNNEIKITDQSLWLNEYIKSDKKYVYFKNWEIKGIHQISDIIDNSGKQLSHEELKTKYNIETNFYRWKIG